jgi:hypothetical protein
VSDPNGADETVVTIEVEHVEGVISLPDMISRIDERANARIAGPPRAAADPAELELQARLRRVRDLTRQLAEELSQLPEEI